MNEQMSEQANHVKVEEEEEAEKEVKVMTMKEAESKWMNERANVRDKDVFFYLASPS